MSFRLRFHRTFVVGACLMALVLQPMLATAGHRLFRTNAVGGISINAAGVVKNFDPASRKLLLNELRKELKMPAGDLKKPSGLRMVSLKGLNAAIEHAMTHNLGELPAEVRYMAGLQRIQFVFVYPEDNDIVLAGPGEGWVVDAQANVVGITTGRPVLQLDDFITALRHVRRDNRDPISCSIDPTAQGYAALNRVLGQTRKVNSATIPGLEARMKEAFGPQQVKLTGVPQNSHYARVMVAADYKMKRLAMNLDRSPVKGMASYVSMLKGGRGGNNVNPRWWLACNYKPLAVGADGLAWEIRGQGVKAMTEDEFVDNNGKVKQTGRKSPLAQKWADTMTAKYNELSQKDPIFGELRNIMDMSVVAALLVQNDLVAKAKCNLPMLMAKNSQLQIENWNSPKTVDPQCSFLRTGRGWVVTASGGVDIDPWSVSARTEKSSQVDSIRTKAVANRAANQWWWN